MTALEQRILEALRAFDAAVARPGTPLRPHLDALAQLGRDLPPNFPPLLRHYLEKHSYAKARLHLEGGNPEAGECPPGGHTP